MRFLRDPLVAFLAAGAVLLLASRWWSGSDTSERIVVSDGVRARLSDQWQMQMRRLPTAEELAGLVDAFIREEIYYREAMRMGLDADDTIVRRRLVQKLTFLTEDIATAAQPDDATLLAWYDAHPDACSRPPRMSFEHRYFSVDRRENAQEDATAALADATQAGDPFMLQRSYAQRAEREIGDLFGRTFASELFTLEPGDWQGPIRSAYGWHLVRISEKLPAARIPFAECRDRVLADLQMQARKEANDAYYQELLSRYTVVTEP